MNLSDKEIKLYDFIGEERSVTIKDIQTVLGEKAVGGLGKLLRSDKIEKCKIREGEGYNAKSVVHYKLKENISNGTENGLTPIV